MSFITLAALLVGVLVVAPLAAHLLRRKNAEEQPFPPAALVPPTRPVARRRSALEDRILFALRALAVLGLALLGASPFVRCARLTVARRSGASVALAIVVDDSLSMRASVGPATRFDKALGAARELVTGLRGGDSVAVVLAGAPARVALSSTTDLAAARAALDGLEPSDRATDLDGAVQVARGLLRGLPQPDKRVVLLSDLADGQHDAPPLRADDDIALWAPLADLDAKGQDCAITRADLAGTRVWVRVVCSPATAASGRSVQLRAGDKTLREATLATASPQQEIPLDLPAGSEGPYVAALSGTDAIAEDDSAPVVPAGGALSMAIVVDAATGRVATGGAPPIEQALDALALDVRYRPLPSVPEHAEDLANFAALAVDNPPGFTPEVRRAVTTWVKKGGVLFLALGPRAAAAPLGAGFDPLVPGVVRWGPSPSAGVDPASATSLGPSADGLAKLGPHGRLALEPAALADADVLAKWTDGAPFLTRRAIGRGAVMTLALPLSADESELVVRPAFLALLDRFVATARARGGARRIDVGEAWTFDGYERVSVTHLPSRPGEARKPIPVLEETAQAGAKRQTERRRALAPLAGLYELGLDGETTMRVATVPDREIDLRPRGVSPSARAGGMGGVAASLDASPYVALGLLGLLVLELVVRALTGWMQARAERAP